MYSTTKVGFPGMYFSRNGRMARMRIVGGSTGLRRGPQLDRLALVEIALRADFLCHQQKTHNQPFTRQKFAATIANFHLSPPGLGPVSDLGLHERTPAILCRRAVNSFPRNRKSKAFARLGSQWAPDGAAHPIPSSSPAPDRNLLCWSRMRCGRSCPLSNLARSALDARTRPPPYLLWPSPAAGFPANNREAQKMACSIPFLRPPYL